MRHLRRDAIKSGAATTNIDNLITLLVSTQGRAREICGACAGLITAYVDGIAARDTISLAGSGRWDFTDANKIALLTALDQQIAAHEREITAYDTRMAGHNDGASQSWFYTQIMGIHQGAVNACIAKKEEVERVWTVVYEFTDLEAAPALRAARDAMNGYRATLHELRLCIVPGADGVPYVLAADPIEFLTRVLETCGIDEKTFDHALQERALALLEDERFTEEIWVGLDAAGRQVLLEEFYGEIGSLLGIDIDAYTVQIAEAGGGGTYRGVFRDQTIIIDTSTVNDYSVDYILRTVIHETRHVMQHEAMVDHANNLPRRHPNISDTTADAWWKSARGEDSLDYHSKAREWDAWNFARNAEAEVDPRPGEFPLWTWLREAQQASENDSNQRELRDADPTHEGSWPDYE
jgi:hypothetical protein